MRNGGLPSANRAKTVFLFAFCILHFAFLLGCQSYRLTGAVIEGEAPGVHVVSRSDKRLFQGGVTGARLEFTVDPSSMQPKRLAALATDDTGRFDAPVEDAPGAGMLEYELGVLARANGYQSVWEIIPLPSADKALLIVLRPGKDTFRPPTDLMEETLELGRKLQQQ